ncbi:hypothetical protein PGT21_031841 [Puccinia graminis f. sp. tritici]|uniref:Uncharacterized protein n=1 Tax=Puccinia graminis f. sp. tritici TaxID=56615 RepID=A0A5B0QBX2_PUCGR|nr:hypothetical protein PGT21_031841 [Puccinia graminis f. sp. tritici]
MSPSRLNTEGIPAASTRIHKSFPRRGSTLEQDAEIYSTEHRLASFSKTRLIKLKEKKKRDQEGDGRKKS